MEWRLTRLRDVTCSSVLHPAISTRIHPSLRLPATSSALQGNSTVAAAAIAAPPPPVLEAPPAALQTPLVPSSSVALPLPHPVTCLFSVRCHPFYDSVRPECERWALSFFDPSSRDSIPTYLRASLFPLLLASFYPFTITRERLVLLTNFTTWLFLLDDTIDEADRQTAVEVAEAFASVLSATFCRRADQATHYKTKDERIVTFVERFRVEVWEKMCRGMSDGLQRRLAGEILRSMEAMKEIWILRQKGLSDGCDEKKMMELRIADGFAWPALLLVEYALGVELPGTGACELPGRMGEVMHKMTEAAAYHIILANDLFSSGKEMANMDAQSMVGCLASQEKAGKKTSVTSTNSPVELLREGEAMQAVLRKTWGMIQEQELVCAELLRQIRTLEDEEGDQPGYAQCLLYAESLCSAMAGNLYWSCRTWRYNGPHPIPWNSFPSYLTISSEFFRPLNVLSPLN